MHLQKHTDAMLMLQSMHVTMSILKAEDYAHNAPCTIHFQLRMQCSTKM